MAKRQPNITTSNSVAASQANGWTNTAQAVATSMAKASAAGGHLIQ